MKLPGSAPAAERSFDCRPVRWSEISAGLHPQGCSPWKAVGCVAAIAGCATSGPGLLACLAAVAPGCIDWVS